MAVETTAPVSSGSGPRPAGVNAPGRAGILQRTLRTDGWKRAPLTVTGILTFFALYSLVRIFMDKWFYVEPFNYLTPIYSPCVTASCPSGARDFGTWFGHFPAGLPYAIIFFPILGGFRATCYYYRKAGYRSLWFAPQACAVPEPHGKYTGERRFPLVVMNAHRYFFWAASILLLVNIYDVVKAVVNDGHPRVGLGTLIMLVNVVALSLYSLSCHACRHAVGGRINHFSKHPVRYKMWTFVSRINPRHGQFAMTSLFTVIISDAYIMTLSAVVAHGHTLPGWL